MDNNAGHFSEGWEHFWKLNLNERQVEHWPTGLRVELRQTDNNVWYPFALNGEDWVAEDQSRLEFFTPLMLQAYALFRENAPETGWLPYHGAVKAIGAPKNS